MTSYRHEVIDGGFSIEKRDQPMLRPSCCCMAFPLRRTCSAISFRRWPTATM